MKKIIGFGLVVVSFVAAAAWLNRIEILLAVVKYQSQNSFEVAENSLIEWQQGPAHASGAAGDRSPNIILIVADDLGFNDISTFGGGVEDVEQPAVRPDIMAGFMLPQVLLSHSGVLLVLGERHSIRAARSRD